MPKPQPQMTEERLREDYQRNGFCPSCVNQLAAVWRSTRSLLVDPTHYADDDRKGPAMSTTSATRTHRCPRCRTPFTPGT